MRCECVEKHGTAQHDCGLCGGCGFQYAGEGERPTWSPYPASNWPEIIRVPGRPLVEVTPGQFFPLGEGLPGTIDSWWFWPAPYQPLRRAA